MTNRKRILDEFQKLVRFDAESGHEEEIGVCLQRKLQDLGLSVSKDKAGNLYGFLPGTRSGDALLFSAHMDTVCPGRGKKAVLHEDGRVTSDGTTVLGADDVSGLTAILESLTVIQEKELLHPDLEILFTTGEELFCLGSAAFDYTCLRSRSAYVLDLTGPVGTAAVLAPSILSVDIAVTGRASHAGFAPEAGINALTISARALSELKTGHTDPETTVNFGVISGGEGRNIVPAEIHMQGEVRSLDHQKALEQANLIRDCFLRESEALHGKAEVTVTENIRAYRVPEDAPVVRHFRRALSDLGYGEGKLISTFGGSDNNNFALHGISGIVLACAMENVHSTSEYTDVSQLQKAAELTLRLMIGDEA